MSIPQYGVPSPCRGECDIDTNLKRCNGCLRTLDEIKLWSNFSDGEKLDLVKTLEKRRAAIGGSRKVKNQGNQDRQPKRRTNPCTLDCRIDSATFLCKGCFRYPEEIEKWNSYNLLEKWRIQRLIAKRRRNATG